VEDIFKRLNKFTMPLKAQELRNATYHGAFAKLAEKLADKEYLAVNRIITPAYIRRMGDIEMMADLLIGLIHGPQGGAAKIINQYYEQYEQYEDEIPGQAKLESLFDRTLKAVEDIFPDLSLAPRWKDALILAAERAGGGGKDALVAFLHAQAMKENNSAFMQLLGRVIPLQINADPDDQLVVVIRQFRDDDGRISASPQAALPAPKLIEHE
jgi:hypothetical protein